MIHTVIDLRLNELDDKDLVRISVSPVSNDIDFRILPDKSVVDPDVAIFGMSDAIDADLCTVAFDVNDSSHIMF
jgi:hypothetical protein